MEQETTQKSLDWAVSRWMDEVYNRPVVNIHRMSLDMTWRQVIKHFGGDPNKLLPLPEHSEFVKRSL